MGRSPVRAAKSAWKLLRARHVLLNRWKRQRPWAVIGTGGYGAAPALLAARSLGIPYFIHESNAQPGLLTRMVAPGARCVWGGMEALAARLPDATCLGVGTPVRQEFLRSFVGIETLGEPFRLLVLGGSGGAKALNEAVFAMAPEFLKRFPRWEILHQTGAAHFDILAARGLHSRHRVTPFLEDMDREMEGACVVISRSGASTCAELKVLGRPAVLVPMPGSASDHQTLNAMAMVQEGRAVLLPQSACLGQKLLEVLQGLLEESGRLEQLARPEPNRAVEQCLDNLTERLGLSLP